MKNNGSLDTRYNIQSVVDSQNHLVIDISTTNDINDQNQLYVMAKDATELLGAETPTVIADTGYYNGAEIKNCIDNGINVLIKKRKQTTLPKIMNFEKKNFLTIRNMIRISVLQATNYIFENTSKNGMKYRKYKCPDCECKYKKEYTSSMNGRMFFKVLFSLFCFCRKSYIHLYTGQICVLYALVPCLTHLALCY